MLIDQADGFVFGFSKLDVMFGRTDAAAVHHPYRDLVKPGVRFVQTTIRSIDPVARSVRTDAGDFESDLLVVALGADLDPGATPGLVEARHEFYTVPGAFAQRDVIIHRIRLSLPLRIDGKVLHISRVVAIRIIKAVLLARGIEMPASRLEVGTIALGDRVKMDGMFAGRQIMQNQSQGYARTFRHHNHLTHGFPLSVFHFNHSFRCRWQHQGREHGDQ